MQDLTVRGEVGTLASMQFIDFEYGGYAYRGHDWGNHFAEYAGFECEYSRYPNNEHIEMFVRAYLNEGAHSPAVRSVPPPQPALVYGSAAHDAPSCSRGEVHNFDTHQDGC